jgi:hypothetical protein
LIGPDNHFLQLYFLELAAEELAEHVMEDASYDLGVRFIGKSKRPGVFEKE